MYARVVTLRNAACWLQLTLEAFFYTATYIAAIAKLECVCLCVYAQALPPSLSLSLSLTHTHTHTHTDSNVLYMVTLLVNILGTNF